MKKFGPYLGFRVGLRVCRVLGFMVYAKSGW
jgi:hypothetical protein